MLQENSGSVDTTVSRPWLASRLRLRQSTCTLCWIVPWWGRFQVCQGRPSVIQVESAPPSTAGFASSTRSVHSNFLNARLLA